MLSQLRTSVMALPISQHEENHWYKIGLLLTEILQNYIIYVPRFEGFMVADFRRMALKDECDVVFRRWRQHVSPKHSCLSANYTLSLPNRQQSLHYMLFRYIECIFLMHSLCIFCFFFTVNKCTINIMQPQIHCLHTRL